MSSPSPAPSFLSPRPHSLQRLQDKLHRMRWSLTSKFQHLAGYQSPPLPLLADDANDGFDRDLLNSYLKLRSLRSQLRSLSSLGRGFAQCRNETFSEAEDLYKSTSLQIHHRFRGQEELLKMHRRYFFSRLRKDNRPLAYLCKLILMRFSSVWETRINQLSAQRDVRHQMLDDEMELLDRLRLHISLAEFRSFWTHGSLPLF